MGVTKRLLEQAELDHAAAMVCQYALSEGLVDESKAEGGIAKLLASGDKGLLGKAGLADWPTPQ